LLGGSVVVPGIVGVVMPCGMVKPWGVVMPCEMVGVVVAADVVVVLVVLAVVVVVVVTTVVAVVDTLHEQNFSLKNTSWNQMRIILPPE
jgi:hypothetical protein